MMKHDRCDKLGPMDFPPMHYYAPLCLACNVEVFESDGEFARWLVTLCSIVRAPEIDSCETDEWTFYNLWCVELEEGAFRDSEER